MHEPRPFITLDNITLRSGDLRLFPDTTWRIHEGEQWVVLGENGSGKSTLLGAFDGSTPVVDGEVWYHFACPSLEESYPDDGGVPEDRIASVSMEDQIALAQSGASYHQARWNASDADAAPTALDALLSQTDAPASALRRLAGKTNIRHRLNHPLPALSNGELRRLLLTGALARKPRLLLLDDPFSGLDTAARTDLMALIDTVIQDGVQTVTVIRRPEEIPERATHYLHVAQGQICCHGPLKKLPSNRHLGNVYTKPAKSPRQPMRGSRRNASTIPKELLSLNNVSVRYGRTTALCDITWRVHEGERWALLGPNGSGKSTLIALMTGDNLQAYANDVRIFGQRRGQGESIWDIRKRIGWVSPELQWHIPGDTRVRDVVASGLFDTIGLQHPLQRKHRDALHAWLDQFDLPKNAPFACLGAGEQRMALLARALIKAPDLILLDEPCQSLDSRQRDAFHRALAQSLATHPCALVYVSHHEDELPPVIDHVFRLSKGRRISD